MATSVKPASIRRAQLYDDYFHRTRGTVTHLFIFQASAYWEQWNSLCGRAIHVSPREIKDNHHLRLCVDCQNRLNLMNELST